MAVNPYSAKVHELVYLRSQIFIKCSSLSRKIFEQQREAASSLLRQNDLPGNYHQRYENMTEAALRSASAIQNYIQNDILATIDARLATLRSKRDSWVDPDE